MMAMFGKAHDRCLKYIGRLYVKDSADTWNTFTPYEHLGRASGEQLVRLLERFRSILQAVQADLQHRLVPGPSFQGVHS